MIATTFVRASLATMAIMSAPAQASTVFDAVGDFLPTFIGPNNADLDVTSFSVSYDAVTSAFLLGASFAGAIDPTIGGIYVIGANTGSGVLAPFAALGQPNVKFNQAIVVRKDGTGNIGATQLAPGTISFLGNTLSVMIPLALLPSTGFAPGQYGFNLWPRLGTGNNNQISDFAPENATLAAGVPEPGSWALMLTGFALIGTAMRYRRRVTMCVA